ncbi:MAG: insulinase family protein [candidate division Zixibacteria bacterium]|nr:insulinase family protein [candidate division Zixibacteria bacterium]
MKRCILLFASLLIFCWPAVAQDSAGPVKTGFSTDLDYVIHRDPDITCGKLDNGLTYYIRVNKKPEKRVELRLAVNAGSVLEDDDQQGLAHFNEHMAFNGTKNFKKNELVDYLESLGMRFGPDLNAYTSFDETVYMLQVPTDSTELVETAFQVLEDWAHQISFEDEEIDKERGVIVEEWRLYRGAGARLQDKQFPILLKGSKYAERMPIGKMEVVENCSYETLKRFYREWYRPDLMTVVAVGDFDREWMDGLIKKYFSRLPIAQKPRAREIYPVPDHKETLFAIATDKEATRTNVSVNYKHPLKISRTVADYRDDMIVNLYNNMLNQRLYELTVQPNPPFLYGYSGKGSFLRSKDMYTLGASVEDNGVERGLKALLVEAERVKRFGFTAAELERQKKETLRWIQQLYNERDKTQSRDLAGEYVRNFLRSEPIPGIAYEYELYLRYLPDITLEEVNRLAGEFITKENRVVMVSGPEKPDVTIPTEEQLTAVFAVVEQTEITPYEEVVSEEPLVKSAPEAANIVAEYHIDELGLTCWMMANGVEVILKPTDFQNDEILMSAFSSGGSSLVDDSDYVPAITAASIIEEGGLADFNQIELQKKLAGKMVNVSPSINEFSEDMGGSSTPDDFETMLQLIYLYFTAPRKDSAAFLAYRNRMEAYIENRNANPEAVFFDTLQVVMSRNHPRAKPWSLELLSQVDLDRSFDIYKERFDDASDFIFIFVGNIDIDKVRPMIQTYLGGLPSLRREESWRDLGIRPPDGLVTKEVYKGIEPKSRVYLVFHGGFDWNRQSRYELMAMADAFRIKLREVIREDLSGTYGIGVNARYFDAPTRAYQIYISFGCDPKRVDELTGVIMTQIDSLKTFGLEESYIEKVKEMQRRERETQLKENNFWLRSLSQIFEEHEDPMNLLDFENLINTLTVEKVRRAAEKYFDTGNYIKVVLYPEDKKQF